MEENNVIEVAEISRENFDGVIDSLVSDRDELRKQLEEKDKQNKKLIQENIGKKIFIMVWVVILWKLKAQATKAKIGE